MEFEGSPMPVKGRPVLREEQADLSLSTQAMLFVWYFIHAAYFKLINLVLNRAFSLSQQLNIRNEDNRDQ